MKAEIKIYRKDGNCHCSLIIEDLGNMEQVIHQGRVASLVITEIMDSENQIITSDYWLKLATYESQIRLMLACRFEKDYYLEDDIFVKIKYERTLDGI
jgi:hypothetical protein